MTAEQQHLEAVWLTRDDEGNFGVWRNPDNARQQTAQDRAAEVPGVYEWVNDADGMRELLLCDDEPTGLTLCMALVADAESVTAEQQQDGAAGRLTLAVKPLLDLVAGLADVPERFTVTMNAAWNEHPAPDQLRLSDFSAVLAERVAELEGEREAAAGFVAIWHDTALVQHDIDEIRCQACRAYMCGPLKSTTTLADLLALAGHHECLPPYGRHRDRGVLMPDTHDERGGDEAAEVVGLLRSLPRTKITPETVTQHLIDRWYREKGNYLQQIGDLCNQIRDLCEQLAAVTARAEKAEARLSTIGLLLPVMTATLAAGTAQAARSAEFVAKAIAHHHRGDAEHMAASAAPDGLSATETAAQPSEAPGVELECEEGVTGPSGVEHETTTCGFPACGHPDHQRDDTTEDGQHG